MTKNRVKRESDPLGFSGFFILALIGLIAGHAFAETIELVTYYPAPGGGNEHLNDLTVGPGYLAENPADGVALIETAVGIGTNNPQEQLHLTGNLRLPETTAAGGVATGGVIFSGATRFIHNFGTTNFFAGVNAGNLTLTGMQNVGVGVNALSSNTVGGSNTAVGRNALANNTTGASNIAVGMNALLSNIAGENNTALGAGALANNTTATNNTAVGASALTSNTAPNNTAVGTGALRGNTTGEQNTALGVSALSSNTTALNNTAVGMSALASNTTAPSNTAVGAYALTSNTAPNNTAVGMNALLRNTTGANNTALGVSALSNNTTAHNNTAVGMSALAGNTTGTQNTAVGNQAGGGILTGIDNTFLGFRARTTAGDLDNATAIGAYAEVAVSRALILGGTGAYAVSVGIGTTTPLRTLHVAGGAGKTVGGATWDNLSDGHLKQNVQPINGALERMLLLRGVTFEWKNPAKMGDRPGQHMGMIAQEVEKIFPEWVKQDPEGLKWLSAGGLLPLMIESVKDLHEENLHQRTRIGILEKRIEALERN